MANNLTAERSLIFRITHVNNVPWILRHGLHCKNSGVRDPDFVRIGNLELIQRRTARNVPVSPAGTLSDHFTSYRSMNPGLTLAIFGICYVSSI
ncbi:DarT ssDNA thymidine ADP-ribosyltransferase family protein [Paracoccus aminovorans]|uniref:DarT ssDNA thymidine ADP-ribosyltransferase family protein n=1 Tax=Paracoccus aminovorans TaxID=34004 RepID=UPI002B258732|nr:DarT ssDNA thymidine ADP-ribosyltransferase family protein [Paracoccus aminovorans]